MAKFQEVAKKLKDANGKWGFEFKDGQGYDTRIMHALMPPIRAVGGDVWANKQCGFDKPEAIAAVKQLHDMVFNDKSIVPPGEQGDYFSGGSAMTINQISRASLMPKAGFKWGIAPLPTGPGGEVAGDRPGRHRRVRRGQAEGARGRVRGPHDHQGQRRHAGPVLPAGAQQRARTATPSSRSNQLIPPEQMKIVADAIAKGKVLPAHEKSPQILAAMKPRIDALWRANADVERRAEGRLHRHPAAALRNGAVAGGRAKPDTARSDDAPWLTLEDARGDGGVALHQPDARRLPHLLRRAADRRGLVLADRVEPADASRSPVVGLDNYQRCAAPQSGFLARRPQLGRSSRSGWCRSTWRWPCRLALALSRPLPGRGRLSHDLLRAGGHLGGGLGDRLEVPAPGRGRFRQPDARASSASPGPTGCANPTGPWPR